MSRLLVIVNWNFITFGLAVGWVGEGLQEDKVDRVLRSFESP